MRIPHIVCAAFLLVGSPFIFANHELFADTATSSEEGTSASSKAVDLQAANDDLSQYQTADALWDHYSETSASVHWKSTDTSAEEQRYEAKRLQLADAYAAEFEKRFPHASERWEMESERAERAELAQKYGISGALKNQDAIYTSLQAILDTPEAPVQAKQRAVSITVQDGYSAIHDDESYAAWKQNVAAVVKQFPQFVNQDELKYRYATADSQLQMGKAEVIYQKTLNTFRNTPLDLKFTAVDGREIDLAKLRGKVVLIDFWATWCGSCMDEVPNVVKTYNDLHDKGFEIVGISSDKDKSRLLQVTKEKGMVWAQYFGGKDGNAIGKRYGIHLIPTIWLVNKKGYLVYEGHGLLREQIEKLLAE